METTIGAKVQRLLSNFRESIVDKCAVTECIVEIDPGMPCRNGLLQRSLEKSTALIKDEMFSSIALKERDCQTRLLELIALEKSAPVSAFTDVMEGRIEFLTRYAPFAHWFVLQTLSISVHALFHIAKTIVNHKDNVQEELCKDKHRNTLIVSCMELVFVLEAMYKLKQEIHSDPDIERAVFQSGQEILEDSDLERVEVNDINGSGFSVEATDQLRQRVPEDSDLERAEASDMNGIIFSATEQAEIKK